VILTHQCRHVNSEKELPTQVSDDVPIAVEGGESGEEEAAGRRSISAFRLAMMAYFFTCGGPFGIEPAVLAAGPLYTLVNIPIVRKIFNIFAKISFIVVPWLWSVPQALLSAELSLMMEQNGGKFFFDILTFE